MRNKGITILLIITFCFSCLFFNPVLANEDVEDAEYDALTVGKIMTTTSVMDLKAKSAILMDVNSGEVMYEKNAHEKLPIASVTKIMTMLLVMEEIAQGRLTFEDMVYVTENSYRMGGSQVYLEPGEQFTVDEMLKAVAIHSANDASVALAEKVAGSEEVFVDMMNKKAKELGMNNTNFLDCSGLTDEGHYSTAYDVALMSRELVLKHPKILEYTSIWHDTFRNGTFSLDNTNKLIRYYQGVVNGIKTGYTSKAGYCLSASATKSGLNLISVVLGEPDSNTRFAEARKLLDYGFSNFEPYHANSRDEIVGSIEVKKGLKSRVNIKFRDDVNLLLKKGQKEKVTKEVKLPDNIEAPVYAGKSVGEVIYTIDGNVIGKADLVADNTIERATFLKVMYRMIIDWFKVGR
ncbi:MAG TPA: D-alanyl-D-alanine carboxypeptidase [Clostridiaceae bacterium]|nr:D-alanyl-D-alanine carboxypeptidase [Clostridiaceae bacterium]